MEAISRTFDAVRVIYRGRYTRVLRAQRRADGAAVVIKTVDEDARQDLAIARLRHERRILETLRASAGGTVALPLEFIDDPSGVALVFADEGGETLATLCHDAPLSVDEALQVGVGVARALMQLHLARVMHKDINPNNILWNRRTGAVQVIDFDIASTIATEPTAPTRHLEGTLSYLSPEQTGRIQRTLDYRTDLYSLGVTLYFLLARDVPFPQTDPVDLIHAILTSRPTHLSVRSPGLGPMVAAVVDKLLDKQPAERYQSAYGVLCDLQRCIDSPGLPGEETFSLGADDRSQTFILPDRLYGREADRERLRQAYERAAKGSCELVMVSGPSGIGKSALVNELRESVAQRDGWFLEGKYDQLRRHVPFSALSQGVTALIRSILAQDEADIDRWRQRLQQAVGSVGQPLVSLVPVLELLLGEQAPVLELPPRETENRLLTLWQTLLTAMAAEHPVVLFLDDLQWGDPATLKLFRGLGRERPEGTALLVVLGYRDDELQGHHPLFGAIREVATAGWPCTTLAVGPMHVEEVGRLLQDATRAGEAEVQPLARLILSKTAGNPFFVRQFLQHMWDQQIFTCDFNTGVWLWDLDKVRSLEITDNVVTLVTYKLNKMEPHIADMVGMAACLGNAFTLAQLQAISGVARRTLADELLTAATAGIVAPLGANYRYADSTQESVEYRFVHDRVQQAAYERLDQPTAIVYHRAIGKHLRDQAVDVHATSALLFAAADHLNKAASLLTPDERLALIQLNLRAVRAASAAAAYSVAAGYARSAAALLPADGWKASYDLARDVYLSLADSFYLAGDPAGAAPHLEACLKHSRDGLEQAGVQYRRVVAMTALGEWPQAIEAASQGLRLLGMDVQPGRPRLLWQFLQLKMHLQRMSVDRLANAPPIQDERLLLRLKLLDSMGLVAYYVDAQLWRYVSLEMALLTLQHGNSNLSVTVYSRLAVLCAQMSDYATALRFCRLCERLENTVGRQVAPAANSHRRFAHAEYVSLSLGDILSRLERSCATGMETGDALYVGWSITCMLDFAAASRLDHMGELMERYSGFFARRAALSQRKVFGVYEGARRCALGESAGPTQLEYQGFTEEYDVALAPEGPTTPEAAVLLANKVWVLWTHGDLEGAYSLLRLERRSLGPRVLADATAFLLAFYACLTLTQRAAQQGRRKVSPLFTHYYRKVAGAYLQGEGTFAGCCLLVQAERLGLRGRSPAADMLYEQACASLSRTGYHRLAAAAHECAGRYYMRHGLTTAAASFLQGAYRLYRTWGGKVKIEQMEAEFSTLWPAAERRMGTSTTGLHRSTSSVETPNLDMAVVLRVAQSISSEVVLDKLVVAILRGAMESAGATRGMLILPHDGQLHIYADSAATARDVPLSTDAAPEKIIRFVARTGEALLLANASREPQFADSYMMSHKPQSVLCLPVQQQKTLRGVIYLENRLNSNAFTANSMAVVEVLAAQAAISLGNAKLYASLEDVVRQRTSELRDAHAALLKLERSNTESQMAGGFAHEMRNVLSAARMMLDSALASMGSEPLSSADAPPVREILQNVVEATDRALQITRQILDYSQIGRLVRERSSSGVAAVVQKVARTLDAELRHDAVQLHVSAAPSLQVQAKEEHLYSILDNLIRNARDAVCEAGNGAQRRVEVLAKMSGEQIEIQVQDNGPGIPATLQARLFEPFFTTKGTRGTGLGLGVARRLAELYGGSVEYIANEGAGATFRVRLPVTEGLGGSDE